MNAHAPSLWRLIRGWGRSLPQPPSRCQVCGRWPGQAVCADCLARFAPTVPRCPGCAQAWNGLTSGLGVASARCPDCLRSPLPLDGCLAAVDYAYPWNRLIQRLKFQGETGWAPLLAERMLAEPGAGPLLTGLDRSDLLLPLPLSTERLAERGFNQAWELARAIHRRSGCIARLEPRLLLRLQHAPAQSSLGREQRAANVRGAFALDPLRRHEVAGRQVVLVDDVMTSGASLSAAAEVLHAAGAHSVSALVLARTPA